MGGMSQHTTEHDLIRAWIEARGGRPAIVRNPQSIGETEELKIDFSETKPSRRLKWISWSEFFSKFEEKGLAMLFQDRTNWGSDLSYFARFVKR